MVNGVHPGIYTSNTLAATGRNHGHQRCQNAPIKDLFFKWFLVSYFEKKEIVSPVSESGSEGNKCVWSPSSNEQCGESDSNFSDADLGRFLVLIAVATQGWNVHLLGLGLEAFLVFADRFDNLWVVIDQERKRDTIWIEENGANE